MQQLFSYEEFRLALGLLRGLMLVCVGVLVMLTVCHVLYYLGRRTPIYRRNPPVDGWNRRFFVATILLTTVLLVLSWGIHSLLQYT
ncbi:hypothetical protein EYC58_05265 [Candidatus Saccharibacteria bacterium]|nr:MAG: hypothetical protein EYC58_05265 [Candidatus Saccharibacteria bacterium]